MAHLRFTRDRRGYETTALLHAGGRRRGKGQRLLYWFRTPPGVRVGRAPIDEDAIRLLEENNPDVQFDWTRILKDPAPAPARDDGRREPRPPHERREGREGREGRDGRDRRRDERPRQRPSGPVSAPPAPSAPTTPEYAEDPQEIDAGIDADEITMGAAGEAPAQDEPPPPLSYAEEAAAQLESVEAESAGEVEAEAETEGDEAEDSVPPPSAYAAFSPADEGSASYQRLGAEGLVRLRARYAEVMARIAEQPIEDEAKEQLKARAERLNPDGWVTADEVAAALEQYETVFEELRAVVGREPRRRRRRRR